jgi:hypothetical protein
MAWHDEHADGRPKVGRSPDQPPQHAFVSGISGLVHVVICAAVIWTTVVALHIYALSTIPGCTTAQIASFAASSLLSGPVPLLAACVAIRVHTAFLARWLESIFRRTG